jgi:hypothetical protein
MNKSFLLVIVLLTCAVPGLAADMEITPFRTVNQSPLVQIFGIPADSSAVVTEAGHLSIGITQDVASEYTVGKTAHEQITLDGESYRWTLAARYGLGGRFEAGIDIPYVLYGGGFLDGFIEDWHKTFGLPNGGRETASRNKLGYSYTKDGIQKLNMRHAGSGLGDISLHGGMKLYDQKDSDAHDRLTLRASIKLPTGESGNLYGSGSTDFALSLCGSMNNFTEWGSLGVFGSVGGMAMTKGDVLRDQQKSLAAFGNAGLGWGPTDWIAFKVQLNAHTPMYHGSSLTQLSKNTLMLVTGGTAKLPGEYLLDIGVSEDIVVSASPDVAIHLGVSKQF